MTYFTSPLDHVRIAAPCPAEWDNMFGDERVRFCAQCKLNVFNLSEMTRAEAELLIARTEGRMCIRYYRRRDGSILTRNCPVGFQAIKRRVSRVANAVASAVVSFLVGLGAYGLVNRNSGWQGGELVFDDHVMGKVAITVPEAIDNQRAEMGKFFVTTDVGTVKTPNKKKKSVLTCD